MGGGACVFHCCSVESLQRGAPTPVLPTPATATVDAGSLLTGVLSQPEAAFPVPGDPSGLEAYSICTSLEPGPAPCHHCLPVHT